MTNENQHRDEGQESAEDDQALNMDEPSARASRLAALFDGIHERETHLPPVEEFAQAIIDTMREALLVLTIDLHVKSANHAFYRMFHVTPEETEGRLIYELGNNQWDIPELRTLLEEVLPDNKVFNGYEVAHDFEQIGKRVMLLNARRLDHMKFILLAIEDITGRRLAEQAKRIVEERYQTALETSPIVVANVDQDLRYDWVFIATPGIEASSYLGKRDDEMRSGAGVSELMDMKRRVFWEGKQERQEIVFGGTHPGTYEITLTPVLDDWGEVVGLNMVSLDITERKQAEAALLAATGEAQRRADEAQEGENVLRVLMEHANEGITLVGGPPDFSIRASSRYGLELIKRPADEVKGQPSGRHAQAWGIHRLDGRVPEPQELPLYRATRFGEVIANEEWLLERGDGEMLTMLVNVAPVIDGTGQIVGAVNCWRDITERKQMEEDLRRSERLYRTLAANLPNGAAFVVDRDLRYVLAEGSGLYQAGMDPKGMEGKTVGEAFEPDMAKAHAENYVRALKGEPFATRHAMNGRHFSTRGVPLRNETGEIYAVLAVSYDITEQVAIEEALRDLNATLERRIEERTLQLSESEGRFRALVEASARTVWTSDAQGLVIEDSPSFRGFTGMSVEDYLDEGWLSAVHPDDRERIAALWSAAVENKHSLWNEMRLRNAKGEWRWVETRAVPLNSSDGSVRGWVGMHTDITERKEAEEALRALNRKLEARTRQVRALASTVTMAEQEERRRVSQILHDDLQQRLYGIQMKIGLARQFAETGQLEKQIQQLEGADAWLLQAIQTTRHLAVELSPPVLKNDGLADALAWLTSQMRELHGLQVDLLSDHPFQMENEDMRVLLFQTVRELLFNVVKHAGTNQAVIRLEEADNMVLIHVVDQGCGFDTQQAEALLVQPSGFGLFSMRDRLQLFGGEIEISSAPNEGTHVIVRVPRSAVSLSAESRHKVS